MEYGPQKCMWDPKPTVANIKGTTFKSLFKGGGGPGPETAEFLTLNRVTRDP